MRRVALLCCHYLGNCAYYIAGWDGKKLKRDGQFFRRVNGNFLDLCCLEFCKLFVDKKGQHYWEKVVTNHDAFMAGLLNAVGVSEAGFQEYIKSMKFYRDKYVAHLDEETGGNYPTLAPGKAAAQYLFDYVVQNENDDDFFPDLAQSATDFYAAREAEGNKAYT
jgi:hypothetical protein